MLVAPCEVHPIYNVTGVEWLAENKPDLKTAVVCAQDDSLGKPSVATYLAAFEAAGIEVLDDPSSSIRRRPTSHRSCRRCWR